MLGQDQHPGTSMANQESGRNVVEGHKSAAASMVVTVPFLKSYVRGFPFVSIDKSIDLVLLHRLFDNDPELHTVLGEIDELVSRLIQRDEELIDDANIICGFTVRRISWSMEVDEDKDNAENYLPPTQAALSAHVCEWIARLSGFLNDLNNHMDEYLRGESASLAAKLNAGIQRLLNAEIVPLVTLLRKEQLQQERGSTAKKKQPVG